MARKYDIPEENSVVKKQMVSVSSLPQASVSSPTFLFHPRQKCRRPTDRQHLCPVRRTKQNGVSRLPLQSSERPQTLLLPRAGKTVHKFPTASLCADLPIPPHKINVRWYARLTESPQSSRTKPKDSVRLASFYAPNPEGR